MPTYSYRCKDCQHEYEAFQSIKEEAHKLCPVCEGTVLRLIGAGAGIVFKGSGFYVTDYRAGAKAETKEVAGKAEPAKSSDAKGDSSAKKNADSPSSNGKTTNKSSS